jgi:hypothetical protein
MYVKNSLGRSYLLLLVLLSAPSGPQRMAIILLVGWGLIAVRGEELKVI